MVFAALLAIFNAPLLGGLFWDSMIFRPEAVGEGEWWRVLAHPFVHATWYHLLLDGAAFFLLYLSLAERRLAGRLACVVAGGFGSLMCSWWAAPAVSSGGLCGLSGIAHALMAVSAVEMISLADSDSAQRRLGWVSFVLVVGKAALEAVSGRMFFTFLHFGLMGEPVAVSHAGGVVGGLSMLWLLRRARHWQPCGRRQAGLARHGPPGEPAGDERSTHSVPCAELAVLRGGPCRGGAAG
jgi:rhomboid family GlyGly-CTERM serine protease